MNLKMEIYLDDGRVFSYEVPSDDKGREHASAIVSTGYRHNDGTGTFEWYPPHRILKVKVTGGVVRTKYTDEVSGT